MGYKTIDNKLKLKSGAVIYFPHSPKIFIKHAQIGSIVQFNGNTATVISHGEMGTRIKVLSSKTDKGNNPSMTLGLQIISSLTECTLKAQGRGKNESSTQIGRKLPLTIF